MKLKEVTFSPNLIFLIKSNLIFLIISNLTLFV